ncbi:UNVERIFIED_CONTAM: putative late blight resistance proteinR1B-17 [Sesamum radiatum]|uniref:Late blight resistance proteinR1B-17 n=1 Tax=Sesamum radiatum TaxID=300843 RepID=A0AAW2S0K7_SESRA
MAYAAVVSLKLSIQRLLNSCDQIPILPPYPEIIQLAYNEVESLDLLLSRVGARNSEWLKGVEAEIREAAFRLEDVIESALVSLSQSQPLSADEMGYLAMEVKKEIDLFTKPMEKIKEQLRCRLWEHYEEAIEKEIPPRTDHFVATKSKIFGLNSDLIRLKGLLTSGSSRRQIVSIWGMAGIGKTTLAKEVYGHRDIFSHFGCRAFVSIGPKYRRREIWLRILAQINCAISDKLYEKNDEELCEFVGSAFKGKLYLIVLDDVWRRDDREELTRILPDNANGSRILLTTRIEGAAVMLRTYACHRMRFLTEKDSWDLLCEKVFGGEHSCPPQLEEVGKKIAKKCEGLPLAIIAMAKHLSEAEKTPEYWSKVAEKEISNIIGADAEMSKALYLSYNKLSQRLKVCFVYMGVFAHGYEIPTSKLINLWCAEGFVPRNTLKLLQDQAMEDLEDLVSNSVVLVCQQSSYRKTKTCKLHSVFQHLCIKEAGKDKVFHILDSYANQGIESQRRLCILNNVLFGIKDVYKLMASRSNTRSLLCTGAHHPYPVPMCLDFGLLSVLDALTIRFYGFPTELVKLIQLRYLSFTYNAKLPASISKLQNLHYLIVHQYLSIRSSRAHHSNLPVEIWDMQELRHLQVMGSDLPDPTTQDACLPNLLTLLGISGRSCTKEVLRRIPNLKKLGTLIELPLDVAEPLCCFDHLVHLADHRYLKSFKCSIVNPSPRLQVLGRSHPIYPILPQSLRKLTLSGLGFPWEYMRYIANLPFLEVLKLRCYAFQGPEWSSFEGAFWSLKFLLVEDTDLEYWRVGLTRFPSLQRLFIHQCYKLKEMPLGIGEIPALKMVEIVDGSPSLVASAKQMQEKLQQGK